jgi:hypothetical protein
LEKLADGRYICDGYELTSGYRLEVLIYDENEECYRWVATRIEHNGEDYYLVGLRDASLASIRERIREPLYNRSY